MADPVGVAQRYDVFLSYRSDDVAEQISAVAAGLTARELTVFYDRTAVRESAFIPKVIADAIAATRVMVIWYSRRYSSSLACLLELVRFLSELDGNPAGRLLVVNPEETTEHIRPAWLLGLRHVAAPDGGDYRTVCEIIERCCRDAKVGGGAPRLSRPRRFGDYPVSGPIRLLGRGVELLEIFDAFHAVESADASRVVIARDVVVSGPALIGKSSLVRYYVELFCRLYPGGIFWIALRPDQANDPYGRLIELAVEAGLLTVEKLEALSEKGSEALHQFIRARLHECPRYLWVVEGGEDATAGAWRPPTSNGLYLSTRGIAEDNTDDVIIRLGPLEPVAMETGLREALGERVSEDARRRFVAAAFGLPGQIALIAAHVRDFGVTQALAFLESEADLEVRLARSYAVPLDKRSPGEAQIVEALALVARVRIPMALARMLHRLSGEPAAFENCLRRLRALGLIELRGVDGLTVPDPVRHLCSRAVPDRRDLLIQAVAAAMPANTRVQLTRDLIALADEAKTLTQTVCSDATAILLQRLGTYQALIGDHAGERDAFVRSHKWLEEHHGGADVRSRRALAELASCFRGEDERDLLQQLLDLYDRYRLHPDHLMVSALQQLGVALDEAGMSMEGLQRLDHAAALLAELGPSADDPARGCAIQNSRAVLLWGLGREREALDVIGEAERIGRAALAPDSPDLLRVVTNQALWIAEDDPARAVRILTDALDVFRRSFGDRHHLACWAAYNLFSIMVMKAGDWTSARKLFLRHLAWLFRDAACRPLNRTHHRFRRSIVRGNDGIFRQYLTLFLPPLPTLDLALDRSELMMIIEYLDRGAGSEAFLIMLGDYLWASERAASRARRAAMRTRMVERWLATKKSSEKAATLRYGKKNYRAATRAVSRYCKGYGRNEMRRVLGDKSSGGGVGMLTRLLSLVQLRA